MKFSKYISKAVTPVMALFQKQHRCPSNKATTICGYSVCSLRQVPVRHNRGGKSTEKKVRFAPPTMCRLTRRFFRHFFSDELFYTSCFSSLQTNFLCPNNCFNNSFVLMVSTAISVYVFGKIDYLCRLSLRNNP